MEIREIKKAKPQVLSEETTTTATTTNPPIAAPPSGDKKPRRLSEEEKQQRLSEEPKPDKFQHIKIIDCNLPVNRVICECWHCLQGLLIEVEALPSQYLETQCPNCGKCAIRLQANQVVSITPIPSPWS